MVAFMFQLLTDIQSRINGMHGLGFHLNVLYCLILSVNQRLTRQFPVRCTQETTVSLAMITL